MIVNQKNLVPSGLVDVGWAKGRKLSHELLKMHRFWKSCS